MSARTGFSYCFIVIAAAQKVEVPYLRLSRHEELYGTGKKERVLIITESAEIGGIDLIVHVFLSVKVLYVSAALLKYGDEFIYAFIRQKTLKVEHWYAVMASQHVDRTHSAVYYLICPGFKALRVCRFERVDQKTRQEEIINVIAFFRQHPVYAFCVCSMDLRQQRQPVSVGDLLNAPEKFPCLGLVHEIAASRRLRGVCKRVKPDYLGSV